MPSSNKNLPPIADTIPSAASIPDPPENLTLSPTAYCLPAVWIKTSLTDPSLIVLTNTSAFPFPLSESKTAASDKECNIPSLVRLVSVTTVLIVNVILISVVVETASICSPVSKVPDTFSNSNSDT